MDTKEQKYRLTKAQLRDLDVTKRPGHDKEGKVTLVANKGGKPYRFRDATPGAPIGFGFYVGPKGAFYEVRVKHNGKASRISLGSVQELSLTTAHELAGAQRAHIRQTGEDPRERLRVPAVHEPGADAGHRGNAGSDRARPAAAGPVLGVGSLASQAL